MQRVRAAQMAGDELLGIDRPIPPVTPHDKSLRVQFEAAVEAVILLGFVVFIAGISLYQEGKTERALKALRDLSSPRALVIREGQRQRIAGREVVWGDILVLSEGDCVPAEAIVLSCSNLSTDESLLTEESLPVLDLFRNRSNIHADKNDDSDRILTLFCHSP